MTHTLKLTTLVFTTSFAGLLHAGDYQHSSSHAAHDSYRSSGTQTAGLFDLFVGSGASTRYGNSHTPRYGNYGRSNYGNSGYRNAGYRNGGYNTGYRPTSNHHHSPGYAPSNNRGYTHSRYGGNYGAGYGGGYGSGRSVHGHGGYYGR